MWFLSFVNLVYYIKLIDFLMLSVQPTNHSLDRSHLVMVYSPFLCFWIQFANIFVEGFYIHIHERYQSAISFLVISCQLMFFEAMRNLFRQMKLPFKRPRTKGEQWGNTEKGKESLLNLVCL